MSSEPTPEERAEFPEQLEGCTFGCLDCGEVVYPCDQDMVDAMHEHVVALHFALGEGEAPNG